MDDQFLLAENTHRIAVQLADRWATAVEAQAGRIRRPENLRVTVPDQWLQVTALHHVLVAASMARKHVPHEDNRKPVHAAITAFLKAIVIGHGRGMNQREALVLARDVLEHFDCYWCGTGREQLDEQAAHPGLSQEDLINRYRPSFGTTGEGLPTLRLGPPPPGRPVVEIDLAAIAPIAARELVVSLCAIIGVDVLAGLGTRPLR